MFLHVLYDCMCCMILLESRKHDDEHGVMFLWQVRKGLHDRTLFCLNVSPSIVDPDLPCAMMTMLIGLPGFVAAASSTSGACRRKSDKLAASAE